MVKVYNDILKFFRAVIFFKELIFWIFRENRQINSYLNKMIIDIKTIHFQYYTVIVLIQIKYLWNSEEASSSSEEEEQISRGIKFLLYQYIFPKPNYTG